MYSDINTLLADADKLAAASSDGKDITELGLQVVNSISHAAGLSAKEKRRIPTAADSAPPRPPSRRGHRPSTVAANLVAPSMYLFHYAMPGQPLPADLTFGQLLTILQARGFNTADNFLQFKMKLKSKYIEDNTADDAAMNETIPDQVLLDTSGIPSALQVNHLHLIVT